MVDCFRCKTFLRLYIENKSKCELETGCKSLFCIKSRGRNGLNILIQLFRHIQLNLTSFHFERFNKKEI